MEPGHPTVPDRSAGSPVGSVRLPLDLPWGHDGQPADPRWLARATRAAVALGILLRVVRYLMNYPLWHDEAFVAANFLDRGYLEMLRPLDYYQVCPLLFL